MYMRVHVVYLKNCTPRVSSGRVMLVVVQRRKGLSD